VDGGLKHVAGGLTINQFLYSEIRQAAADSNRGHIAKAIKEIPQVAKRDGDQNVKGRGD